MLNSRVNWKRCLRAVILDSMMMGCFQLSERKGLSKKNSKLKVVPKKFARFGLAVDCTGKARFRARFGLAVGDQVERTAGEALQIRSA